MSTEQFVVEVFLREVHRQSGYALMAADDLRRALESRDATRLWYSVQSLLVAAANISKLLSNATCRGPLRQQLDIHDSATVHDRAFRNHFEHFDDRLERWALESTHHNIVDTSVMPRGAIVGIDERDYLRILDPVTFTLTFRGEQFPLDPLLAELRDIHDRAEGILARRRMQ